MLAVNTLQAAESIAILPGNFTLSGSAARQRLLVEHFKDNMFAGQITNGITFNSSDTNILKIDNDLALPLKNGAVTIRATVGKQTATAKVTVETVDKPFEWSFGQCPAGARQGRVQRRRVSRSGGGPEWLQTFVARLR